MWLVSTFVIILDNVKCQAGKFELTLESRNSSGRFLKRQVDKTKYVLQKGQISINLGRTRSWEKKLGILPSVKWSERVSHSVMFDSYSFMDGSLPGSSVHGILQARILEWVVMSPSGDLPDPGIKPRSSTLQEDSLPSEPPEKSYLQWK